MRRFWLCCRQTGSWPETGLWEVPVQSQSFQANARLLGSYRFRSSTENIDLVYLPCTSLRGFWRVCLMWRFVFSVTYVSSTTRLGSIPTRRERTPPKQRFAVRQHQLNLNCGILTV